MKTRRASDELNGEMVIMAKYVKNFSYSTFYGKCCWCDVFDKDFLQRFYCQRVKQTFRNSQTVWIWYVTPEQEFNKEDWQTWTISTMDPNTSNDCVDNNFLDKHELNNETNVQSPTNNSNDIAATK